MESRHGFKKVSMNGEESERKPSPYEVLETIFKVFNFILRPEEMMKSFQLRVGLV